MKDKKRTKEAKINGKKKKNTNTNINIYFIYCIVKSSSNFDELLRGYGKVYDLIFAR